MQSKLAFNMQGLSNDSFNFFARDITVRCTFGCFFVVNNYKYNGALHLTQSHRVAESL